MMRPINEKEFSYWIALAHDLPMWSFSNKAWWKNEDKMNIIIKFFNDWLNIIDFFWLSNEEWIRNYWLTELQVSDLNNTRENLSNNAFLVETLQRNWVSIVPIITSIYSSTLKKHLQKSAPILLYVKGNRELMQSDSISIVWSRNASDIALEFTDNIVKNNKSKVIVSWWAKWVDQKALESALTYWWNSIIVIPQWINTIESWIKKYYTELVQGRILILSTFHPNTPRQKELAMARNSTIYALSQKIYVAESKSSTNKSWKITKWWTYSWVIDWLKKIEKWILSKNSILIRKPWSDEMNDNNELIRLWWIPVDMQWNIVEISEKDDIGISIPKQRTLF